ncbi:MAG: cell division protein FtsL [Methylomonas sp.]|jgi:cell division protein FtsL|uniref:cell division protein FtsL n=1 Tax=Methylomonas sp. TaxID=418 RepID=UPI0025E037D1|nr:cell division protein FtsL [Methylomonas sp.]MCK9607731.1 cell division protein FtsL [Methylomonas sp.]
MAAIKNILLSILIAMLLLSAIAVIYSKYQSRQLFIEIQKKEKQLDDYEVEWGRLQLELTTLTEENRIEIEARKRLMLTLPAQNKIVYIKP